MQYMKGDLGNVETNGGAPGKKAKEKYISVGVNKIDKLIDLLGELVVSQSMVINNPDLNGMELINFQKAARQLKLVVNEVQDVVMSVRMVPLRSTLQKMNRLVRDVSKETGKEVQLDVFGEETEVDKNVAERLVEPLMHIVRNSIQYGIESAGDRVAANKSTKGVIVIEAKHLGGNVWITVKDDGQGISKEKILERAEQSGMLSKPKESYHDKEIYSLVFQPGVSGRSGPGEADGRVAMDAIYKDVNELGGTMLVESEEGRGSDFSIVLPLTLAIVDGMMLKVGSDKLMLPITAVKESFNTKDCKVVVDPEGREMIVIRGECYSIQRLSEKFGIKNAVEDYDDGILVMLEHEHRSTMIFVDALIGEQQVVVKNLPKFIDKVSGVSGCALLGDGTISLILDPAELVQH